jgi:putative transposase
MPRRARAIEGGIAYHVLSCAHARLPLFKKEGDFTAFERVLDEAFERERLWILGYCLMPNHWHLVVWPQGGVDRQVSEFMRSLTVTHMQRWHAHRHTAGTGHLYQGRLKFFPIQSDEHLYAVLRYVERNPVRADPVRRAEQWQWSSLCHWHKGDELARRVLSVWPFPRPEDWLRRVNRAETKAELEALHRSVRRGQPFGGEAWTAGLIARLGLQHTVRPQGRPPKAPAAS